MCIIVGIKRGCCRDQLSVCMRQHMPPATAIHVQARLALLLLRYAPNCLRTCWFVPPALYLNVSKSEDPTHPVRASASPYEYPGGTSEQPRSRRDSDPRPLPKTLAPIREMREDVWRSRLAACKAVQRVQQNNNLPSFRRIGPRTGRGCNVPRPHQAGRGFCEGGSTSSISGVHSIISLGPGGVVELRNSQAKHSGKQSHQRSPCRSMSSQ